MKKNILPISLELLDKEKKEDLHKLSPFFKQGGVLAGGTALMFQLGHRRSYDFDIFFPFSIPGKFLRKVSEIFGRNFQVLMDNSDNLTFSTPKGTKVTLVYFPFPRLYPLLENDFLAVSSWKDIASDKAYAIGRRPQYRDYIDLFFILKKGFSLKQTIKDAEKKFGGEFSEKLFLSQLSYLKDVKDFSIEFLKEKVNLEELEKFFLKQVKNYGLG
ncbi:MAG: hypothetical protein AUJ43_00305 [Parcubacteria group bacterium CG1_02_44_31]|nr:MAG: hypothetical protein AUJ43_00305 [Parcubacteria group bacterium CG1_02_44_31]